jgi:o-succinylbenzoate synthase
MHCTVQPIVLKFKVPAGTSRGVLLTKPSWIVELIDEDIRGKGEISIIPGLSPEFTDEQLFTDKIHEIVKAINEGICDSKKGFDAAFLAELSDFPSILFGLETAWLDFKNGGKGIYFDNAFSRGEKSIPINGLIWMGDPDYMRQQIAQKIADGFTTLKMKIGAIGLNEELDILRSIRANYSPEELTLRVDANGAFQPHEAPQILEHLAELGIHSIEQPIAAGNSAAMHQLCSKTPIPIALDEELIGVNQSTDKIKLLEEIEPQYIILKPSLHGGISGTHEWIALAEAHNIPWWMTSALESNIGLSAICQLAGEYDNVLPQGLGTGGLYENNFESNLVLANGTIRQVS